MVGNLLTKEPLQKPNFSPLHSKTNENEINTIFIEFYFQKILVFTVQLEK